MDHQAVEHALAGLPIGPVRFFTSIGSTNSEAVHWAEAGATDLALVIADEQTAGRGRLGRQWFTPAGAALAFSLVLRTASSTTLGRESPMDSTANIAQLTALGALAVSKALRQKYGLPAEIKWPNDVLLNRQKVAGVLVEAHWHGAQFTSAVLGIGINIAPTAVPFENALTFPATCVETIAGQKLSRLELLRAILIELIEQRKHLGTPQFIQDWEKHLAFRNEWVHLVNGTDSGDMKTQKGRVEGIDPQGGLKLINERGVRFIVYNGEIHLRPISIDQAK